MFAYGHKTLSCVLMTLTEGKAPVTSSYIGSICVLPVGSIICSSNAVILALHLDKIMIITITEATTLTIKAVPTLDCP